MFRLLRPLGVEWTVRRIRHGVLRDLERLAGPEAPVNRNRFASRMFDRINALFSRLDATQPEQRALLRSALAALRVGFNIMLLKEARRELPWNAATAIDRVLAALERHFREVRTGTGGRGSLHEIDDAVALLLARPTPRAEDLLMGLVALGSALHQHADLFGPARSSPVPHALRHEALA
jgi:hypothetical protein